jgi:outer membrane protein OmpA-like peptidoglycan-associated protein
MKSRLLGLTTLGVAVTLAATGCANMSETQKNTGIGAAIGTVAGAAIGRATAGGDKAGSTRTGAAVGAAAGALGGYIWSKKMEEQKKAMEQATQGTGVAVTQTPDNQLKLNIPSDISFDTGKSDIKSNFAPILDQFASGLKANPTAEVKIIGHTDSQGSDAVNDPLSVQRAASTRAYLASRGADSSKIAIDGRGEKEPIADNGTTDGRAKNRRVEIFMAEKAQ